MSNAVTKYENFFPEKCITVYVWRMQLMKFLKEIRSYTAIMPAISECCVGNAQLFCTRVSKKSDCLFLCQPHLLITMMIEGTFDCTSEDEKDIEFDALQERYCRSCVRHHCQKYINLRFFNFYFF